MEIKQILNQFHNELEAIYGSRLKKVVLYGSWAVGKADDQSDIDLAVVLDGTVKPGKEIDKLIDIITDINLEYSTLLSVYPVSDSDYENSQSPLLINIRKEGVAA